MFLHRPAAFQHQHTNALIPILLCWGIHSSFFVFNWPKNRHDWLFRKNQVLNGNLEVFAN
jgi:hypothetical protein